MAVTERELDMIRGKLTVGGATPEETSIFLSYVESAEELLDESDGDDYFGTEGWRHHIGIE